jgi:acyl carrier protein
MPLPPRAQMIAELRVRLAEIASGLGRDASQLGEDDIIPDSEVVDSAGLLEFVIWYEERYAVGLDPSEMTVDNLGSLARMADFAQRRAAA